MAFGNLVDMTRPVSWRRKSSAVAEIKENEIDSLVHRSFDTVGLDLRRHHLIMRARRGATR
jgi:hypothetical protein